METYPFDDEGAPRSIQPHRTSDVLTDGLKDDSQLPPRHVALFAELRHGIAHHVDRNRETDPLTLTMDGGVDADELTSKIEQRPTAVARVDRGIGLDEVVVGPCANRPILGAHDAHGDGVAQPERIAHGHDVFTDSERVAVAEHRSAEVTGPFELEQSYVQALVATHHFGFVASIIREADRNLVGSSDDV